MAIATLKRHKLEAPLDISEEIKQLARDARLLLRHHDLLNRVVVEQESLREVLRRLDIRPFDNEQVQDYQDKRRDLMRKRKDSEYAWWREIGMSAAKNVPLFALRKAVQIKRACPDVRLFVEGLENDPDPFLVAKLGREKFYIEVWDERDFEAELER